MISGIINLIIKYLSLSEKNILEIKRENNIKFLNKKVKDLYRVLKTKFAMFFIFSLLLLLFFTYYITCFCGIYVNIQFHLLKDSAISFGLSLLYPFLI